MRTGTNINPICPFLPFDYLTNPSCALWSEIVMGICASTIENNDNMGNAKSVEKNKSQQEPKRKKFKSAVSKYGPYKATTDADGNKIWSAPNNEDWPVFSKESDLRKWLLNHVSINDQTNQTVIRKPGTLEGTQFLINNCKNCQFWLLDFTSTITVDKCEKCTFYIGPCESSFFIRDSKNCSAVMAVGQLRTRDCHNMKILLYSQTEPVIEKSTNMKFGCFHSSYFNLLNQMHLVGLNEWQNRWCDVHDFTPGGSDNWTQLPPNTTAYDLLKERPEEIDGKDNNSNSNSPSWTEYGSDNPTINKAEKINGFSTNFSAIPYTYGINERNSIDVKREANVFIFLTSVAQDVEMDVKEYSKTICQLILKLNLVVEEDGKPSKLKEHCIRLIRSKSFLLENDMVDRLFINSTGSGNMLKEQKKNCLFDISVGLHFIVPNTMIEAVGNVVNGELSKNTKKNMNNIFMWKNNSDELRMYFDEFKLSEST